MKTTTLSRPGSILGSSLVLLAVTLFGFAGIGARASAQSGAITNTGPDSNNSITIEDNRSCEVNNDNNINFTNSNEQNATTGNATVGGGDWGEMDPWVWASQGKSQSEWQAAFANYMAEQNYVDAWQGGGGNTTGGNATSGDASNTNSVNVGMEITNSGCTPGTPENPSGPNPSNNPQTLGANTAAGTLAGAGGVGGFLGLFSPGASGSVLVNGSSVPNTSGGSGGDTPNPTPGGSSGCVASIGTTGPGSTNSIACNDNRSATVNNNNAISLSNTSTQTAGSGDSGVGSNTTGGDAATGSASNENSTVLQLGVQN